MSLLLSLSVIYNVIQGSYGVFAAGPRTSVAGLQCTVTALPYANYETEVLDLQLPVLTHIWAVANKNKLSNERQ